MRGKTYAWRARDPAVPGLLIPCLLVLLSQPPAIAKKNKKEIKERLRTLQVVHVVGQGSVARYVKRNFEEKTCLREPEEDGAAEAILTVSQRMLPCRSALSGMCLSVSATLRDAQTGKVLLYRTDDTLGNRLSIGIDEAGGKWILWNLRSSCCRKR